MSARSDLISAIDTLNGVDTGFMVDAPADVLAVVRCLNTLRGFRGGAHARVMQGISLETGIGRRSLYDYVVDVAPDMCGMLLTDDLRRFRSSLQQGSGCCVVS